MNAQTHRLGPSQESLPQPLAELSDRLYTSITSSLGPDHRCCVIELNRGSIRDLIHRLTPGIINANPQPSVINPGVNKTIPPIRTSKPSIKSLAGIRPSRNSRCILPHTRKPCRRAKDAPSTPVTITSARVGPNPSHFPTQTSSRTSTNGRQTNNANNLANIRLNIAYTGLLNNGFSFPSPTDSPLPCFPSLVRPPFEALIPGD